MYSDKYKVWITSSSKSISSLVTAFEDAITISVVGPSVASTSFYFFHVCKKEIRSVSVFYDSTQFTMKIML